MSDHNTTVHEFHPPKSEWGEGPWSGEPDRVDFTSSGFPCLALRNRMGAWCGYVGVPLEHPAHGKEYDDVDVAVHGGLTYAGVCSEPICHVPKPGQPDNVWWLGFDCGHCRDLAPGMEALLRSLPSRRSRPGYALGDVYRDLKYVKAEVRRLARQLKKMEA